MGTDVDAVHWYLEAPVQALCKKASKQWACARCIRPGVGIPRPWVCDGRQRTFVTRRALACHARFAHGDCSSVRCGSGFGVPVLLHVEHAQASLRDPDDHEVREANEGDNEWLRKRKKACEDPLAGPPSEGAVRDGRAAL